MLQKSFFFKTAVKKRIVSSGCQSRTSSLLTLKTNISPLSRVTVSKSPSQISGGWSSGSLGGRGGAGGRGGGGGTSFLTGGVVAPASGGVVGTTGGDVVLGSGSGGGRPLFVGGGALAWGWLGEGASSTGGEEGVGVTPSG